MGFGITPVESANESITNDGFFPNINVSDFQNVFHDANGLDFEKVKYTLKVAMAQVNRLLAPVKATAQTATLIERDGSDIGGVNMLELHYQTAVFGHAKANLLPLVVQVVQRDRGQELETNMDSLQTEYKEQANQAIRFLFDMPVATVELI